MCPIAIANGSFVDCFMSYPILLRTTEYNGDICLWLRTQRFHFHKWIVLHKTNTGQIFATLARVAGHTFANVFGWQRIWDEANAMLAFVMLTRRRLWIHHCNQWCSFTEFARVFIGAFANIVINTIHTYSTWSNKMKWNEIKWNEIEIDANAIRMLFELHEIKFLLLIYFINETNRCEWIECDWLSGPSVDWFQIQ